jgi:hypothetical protein
MLHARIERRPSRAVSAAAASIALTMMMAAAANAARDYDVKFTGAAPTIDGVVTTGEWNNATAAAGTWGVLRRESTVVDSENNRFRMLWDATNLYILYETDFNIYTDADPNDPKPSISFGLDNLNLYFDPNNDDEPNLVEPLEADGSSSHVDGYQIAFNQYHDPANGSLISTNTDRQGVGFFTEAHADTPFGDQATWNNGGQQVLGDALQDIVVAQRNGTTGGVAEIRIPWANFNADPIYPGLTPDPADFGNDGLVDGKDFTTWQQGQGSAATDKTTGDANLDTLVDGADLQQWADAYGTNTQVVTGLDHTSAPVNGEQWFFNMSRINGQGDVGNFLPVWNWQPAQSFAFREHGTITFSGGPGVGAVPEPTASAMFVLAAAGVAAARRRLTA